MTPLEDKLRRAMQAKASQVPPEAVPPLRFSAQRRRSSSLAHGGGERGGAPARRGWLAPAASALVVVALIAASVAVSHDLAGQQQRPAQQRALQQSTGPAPTGNAMTRQAAAWVAAQVSRSAEVSCDPATCRALQADGVAAGHLLVLRRGGAAVARSSAVIVETATVRADVGAPFNARYAPVVLASFGSGAAQIEVRMVEAGGAAVYRSQLATDLEGRQLVTNELLGSPKVSALGVPRRQLRALRVDERLLIMISYLAIVGRVSVVAFGDSGPGAGAGAPLRSAELAMETKAGRPGTRAELNRALITAQQSLAPYRPTLATITRLGDGLRVLSLEYAAPTPLGTINYNG